MQQNVANLYFGNIKMKNHMNYSTNTNKKGYERTNIDRYTQTDINKHITKRSLHK
ncbi:hypothetical protein HanIR_Chr05g0225031 [Helianthus annuus]|nr:hypothetical protein HanIR_Chr05g0225031 [Helianthus annuus]